MGSSPTYRAALDPFSLKNRVKLCCFCLCFASTSYIHVEDVYIQTDLGLVFIDCIKVDQYNVERELDHKVIEISTLLLLLDTAVEPLEQGGVKLQHIQ